MSNVIIKTLTPIAILLSFFNFPVFSILRAGDLFIIFLSLVNAQFYKFLIFCSTFFAFHSVIAGFSADINLFWYFKFITVIAIFTSVNQYVKLEISKSISVLKFCTFLFICWVYFKLILFYNGIIGGSSRSSFPSSDFSIVDSHLYAQVLTILGISYGIISYLLADLQKPNIYFLSLISLCWFVANVLTSSRNGVLITALVFFLLFLKVSAYYLTLSIVLSSVCPFLTEALRLG